MSDLMPNNNNFILYTAPNGNVKIEAYLQDETIWLTQLPQELRVIVENIRDKIIGFAKLAKWHKKVNQSGFKSFNTFSRTIINHYQTILNYFDNRAIVLLQNHSVQKIKI